MNGRTASLVFVLLLSGGLFAQVPFERLRQAADDAGNWLTYSGNYSASRHSSLSQINKGNVGRLRPIWVYQVDDLNQVETTPLVVGNVMYITEPPTAVTALDVQTGRALWHWRAELPPDLRTLGFPPVNRGVAILGDTLYVGTLDAHLVALDAASGTVRWRVQVGDNKTGHSITMAPLALKDSVIVGISGGEAGIRGFLDCYDAETGKLRWRFWTIPAPGEAGSETWGGDSWKNGAGATWLTGAYDPQLDLLYWGIGNPGPDWNGDVRPGDNLYTCSMVALEAATGKLRWHFQFTPHDTHDWDANQIPILIDTQWQGKPRKLLATANRNAFFYVLDRVTGEYLLGEPYAKQTWARGLDENGRPRVRPDTAPTETGNLVWPSLQGSTNWNNPTFSPETGLFYVSVREMGAYYYKGEAEYIPGAYYTAGGERALSGDDAWGAIRALELSSGKIKWDFKLPSPPWSGLLSTAGGLVFGGSNEGNFYALDDETGKALWQFQTGGAIAAGPMTYQDRGKQRVAIAAGHMLFVFGLPDTGYGR